MFFNSIKEMNRLRKEKKLVIKYRNVKHLLKCYYSEKLTFSKLQFSKFKNPLSSGYCSGAPTHTDILDF